MEFEQQLRVPDAPSLPGSIRTAAVDFYFSSWALVAANALWGLLLILVVFLPVPGIIRIAAIALLAVPTAGVYRVAALVTRGESPAISDAIAAYRAHFGVALLIGIAAELVAIVFIVNTFTGLATGSLVGIAFATVSGWSVVFLVMYLVVAWPLIVDPRRADLRLRERLRLAGLLLLAYPLRIGVLTVVTGILLVVSTVLFAALLTISVAYVALLGCRYVLPAADRLEGRATYPVPE